MPQCRLHPRSREVGRDDENETDHRQCGRQVPRAGRRLPQQRRIEPRDAESPDDQHEADDR
jgi:hypothetical protein